jgi:hypothetical protein
VVVADAHGAVTLLAGEDLTDARRWELKGSITAGPFLRGNHVGCVVDRTRLVWIDPTKDGVLWEHRTGGDHIVGSPHLVADMVVVCDEGGTFVGLNPATGKPLGKGYRLTSAVAPAATPIAFGPDRAFAPLTDGTIMLLSPDRLRDR